MRLLNHNDAVTLKELLIESLPHQVLEIVARKGGLRETQIVGEVLRWLPKTVRAEMVRTWVSDGIDWLTMRGDVEKGAGGRYHCVPPYIIGDVDDPQCAQLSLYGHPQAESLLRRALQPFGVTLRCQTICLETDREAEQTSIEPTPLIGVERFISIPPGQINAVVQACQSLGVVIVQPRDLAEALPRIAHVVVPAERDLEALPVSAGIWEVYNPYMNEENRWRLDASWWVGHARLIRWRASDDWRGERNARIFYHAGGRRAMELGTDSASLWQLYLDADAGNPRVIWSAGTKLWVPRMLPVATQQWLRILAGRASRFQEHWRVFEIKEETIFMSVCTRLVNTLGLQHREGRPSVAARQRQ